MDEPLSLSSVIFYIVLAIIVHLYFVVSGQKREISELRSSRNDYHEQCLSYKSEIAKLKEDLDGTRYFYDVVQKELEKAEIEVDELRKTRFDLQPTIQSAGQLRSLMSRYPLYRSLQYYNAAEGDSIFSINDPQILYVGSLSASVSMQDRDGTYHVSLLGCDCPDYTSRRVRCCKHMYRFAADLGFLSKFEETNLFDIFENSSVSQK